MVLLKHLLQEKSRSQAHAGSSEITDFFRFFSSCVIYLQKKLFHPAFLLTERFDSRTVEQIYFSLHLSYPFLSCLFLTFFVRKAVPQPAGQPLFLNVLPFFGHGTYLSSFAVTAMCSSASCLSSTVPGAPIMISIAFLFIGKGMISRMLSSPQMSIIIRSTPGAIPA